MGLNKKGFTLLYALMLGVMLFFLGLAITPVVKDTVTTSMGDTAINCSTTDSTWNKVVCTEMDMFIPLTIGLFFGFAGFIIGGTLS